MTKAESGRLGGKATVKKHGKDYMSEIGARGAKSTWDKYSMQPIGLNQFAMVNKTTNQIVAIF